MLRIALSASVVVLILLQSLRNYSKLYYVALAGTILLSFAARALGKGKIKFRPSVAYIVYISFIIYTVWISLWSVLYNPNVDLVSNVGRLFFAAIIPLLLINCEPVEENVRVLLNAFLFVYILGACTYFYQILFGPIEWFADEPMDRGSVVRYVTILGSGNIYGIGIGVALLLATTLELGRVSRAAAIVVLLLGALMSMQKASVVNIVLWLGFYLLFFDRRKIMSAVLISGGLAAVSVLGAYLYEESFFSVYFQEFIFNSIGVNLFDNPSLIKSTVLDKENLLERFVGLHLSDIFGLHGEVILLTLGVGVTGGGGGMGLPDFPQAHSTYWDLVFIGGVPYLMLFLVLFSLVMFKLKNINNSTSKILFFCNLIFAINAFSATAAVFQPVLSFTFWISVFYCSQRCREIARPSGVVEKSFSASL